MGLAKCYDALARFDPDCTISSSVATGMLRATGGFTAEAVDRLRQSMAALEVPVTVERAPWAILSTTGHYGAFREGVGSVTTRLRETFDPAGILAVPLGRTT
jgi:hypothetical protein